MPEPQPPASGLNTIQHQTGGRSGGYSLTLVQSNADEIPPETNALTSVNLATNDPDQAMSPAERKVARIFRSAMVGSYGLVLLALLAYVAYRYWRSLDQPADKRRSRRDGTR